MKRLVPVVLVAVLLAGVIVVLDRKANNNGSNAARLGQDSGEADRDEPGGGGAKPAGDEKTAAGLEERIKKLIAQLGADEVEDRERAQAALLKIGQPALPLLREAKRSPLPEPG